MRNHFFTRPHAERGRLRHISSSRSAILRSAFQLPNPTQGTFQWSPFSLYSGFLSQCQYGISHTFRTWT